MLSLVMAVALSSLMGCSNRVVVVGITDYHEPAADAPPNFWDPIPESPSTTVPERIVDQYWLGQFHRVNSEVAAADDCRLVFFGDSITKGWTLLRAIGKPVWDERYARFNAINMGNSGDITPVMLYRVTHGNLDFAPGQAPRVAVLLCGTNNYVVTASAGGNVQWDLGIDTPPGEVADGARAIAQVFRRRLPETRVIVLGVLPVRQELKQFRVRQTNDLLSSLDYNNDEVVFLDLAEHFTQADGTLIESLYTDGTHLTEEGYRVWADAIDPVIEAMMDAPPLDPVKIMLIGDEVTIGGYPALAYRRYLDGMLRRDGLVFDFVGSQRSEVAGVSGPENYMFDPDHEGYRVTNSAALAENFEAGLPEHVPDIAVIHAGHADIAWLSEHPDRLAEDVVADIDRMVMGLRDENPRVGIVLTQIQPMPGRDEEVSRLNSAILDYAQAHNTAGSPIVVADLNTGFDVQAGMLPYGTGLGSAGAQHIARVYSVAINRLVQMMQDDASE